MDPKQLRTSLFSGVRPESSSPEVQNSLPSSPEPWTPENSLLSSPFGHTSPTSVPIQQASTSTATISLPSTPSTTSSLMSSPPRHMQHYTIPTSAMDAQDPILSPSSPSRTLGDTPKKIPRPPNAFMLFRSWLIRDGKLPSEIGRRQQNISRIAGKAWNLLDEPSKNGWRKEAIRLLRDHERKYPGYKFELSAKSRRTGLEKIRKAADSSDDDTTRRLKALSDVYGKDHRAVNFTAAQRPRQRASPYKFPVKERTPQKLVWGSQTPQLVTGSQLGSPSMASLITFDSPSPSPVRPLSPLPLHTQPRAFPQGMPQQPFPYTFLPPGLPNHFEQARRQENGAVAFGDSYAPVSPYTSPRYYTFDHTGIVPAVDTFEIMTGTAPNTTAAMLGLYELNSPYAHYNPNLDTGRSGFPASQPPVQTSSVPPMASAVSAPLSTAPLTPHEQQVFNAIMGNSRLPLSLEDLTLPIPLSFPEDGFVTAANPSAGFPSSATPSSPFPFSTSTLPVELLFTKSQTGTTTGPALTLPRLSATNWCA